MAMPASPQGDEHVGQAVAEQLLVEMLKGGLETAVLGQRGGPILLDRRIVRLRDRRLLQRFLAEWRFRRGFCFRGPPGLLSHRQHPPL
jgi:hypothetical protein